MARDLIIPYDREQVVAYAHEWAYRRNPQYYDFSDIGGDCTNFASQCVYAGCHIMNPTPTYGWYYYSLQNRAPAWTSVTYFFRFMTTNQGIGPFGEEVSIDDIEIGDLVQIRFNGSTNFNHTPVVVEINGERTLNNILIAAHSNDCDCRPLSTYVNVAEFRYLHIIAARKAE